MSGQHLGAVGTSLSPFPTSAASGFADVKAFGKVVVPASGCRKLARWGHGPLSWSCMFGCIFPACDAFFRQCLKARTETAWVPG